MDDNAPQLGELVFYLPDKGYGYVRLAGTREEFHFRAKNLRYDNPRAGDLVRFVLVTTRQGYFADVIERANLA